MFRFILARKKTRKPNTTITDSIFILDYLIIFLFVEVILNTNTPRVPVRRLALRENNPGASPRRRHDN